MPTLFTLYIVTILLVPVNQSVLAYLNYLSDRTLAPISEVSTRQHVPDEKLPFISPLLVTTTLSKFGAGCPPETAIYVHGWNRDETEAREEFNRIQSSLDSYGYKIPLIGFSWNSKVLYPNATDNAVMNGPDLAEFMLAFKEECPNTAIRLVAHSLGAEVLERALINLNTDLATNSSNIGDDSKMVESVHFLGASINNNEVINDTDFGNAIESQVGAFYNLYNPQDDGLQFNQQLGNRDPLGLVGAPNGTITSSNYIDTNVAYEIPPFSDADGDGNVEDCFEEFSPVRVWGDNHCGYIGFRQPAGDKVIDDGAMDIVARNWMK